jgi:Domain of unknown function (DUF3471)
LSQIRQVTSLSERDPSLRHILEMQIDTWKERKTLAERGQIVAETALHNLKTNDSLSIDELCDLVRSLEMSDQISDPAESGPRRPAANVDPRILERYVGHYKVGAYALLAVSCQNGQLFAQSGNWPPMAITPDSETEFTGSISQARYTFLTDAEGSVTGVAIHSDGNDITAPRIEAAAADEIRASLAARIQGNTPVPGSEAALRRMIDSLRDGTPNYEEMSPALIQIVRKQLPMLQMMARYLGAIQTIQFKGVGRQGWDVYEIRRENGVVKWRIALTDGLITGAMASVADGP